MRTDSITTGSINMPLRAGLVAAILIKGSLMLGLFVLLRHTPLHATWAAGIATLVCLWTLQAGARRCDGGLTPLMAAVSAATAQMVLMQVLMRAVPVSMATGLSMLIMLVGEAVLASPMTGRRTVGA